MKKLTMLFLSLLTLFALTACGSTSEETAAVADADANEANAVVAGVDTAVNTTTSNEVENETVENTAVTTTTEETTAEEVADVALTEDYSEDALPIRNQLLVGTLNLEGSELAVTPEQAAELLVLWQASVALSRSGTGAPEEVTAVINQIEGTMTPEQIAAISNMQLTREDIQLMAQELGLSMGNGDGEGAGGANRGQGQNMSAEEMATREVEREDRASNGATNALLDMIIELLSSRSAS
ncbi:MAG: hypothetical protein H6653_07510 [Ardenticatenaceae bacterium]|nr:hypothetical protein [Ardenticatenaceae bacterium]